MPKWTRRSTWLLAILTVTAAYVCFFRTRTVSVLEARWIARKTPVLDSIPVELADRAVSEASGEQISFAGVQFEVPWKDFDQASSRIVGKMIVIPFRSETAVVLNVQAPDGFIESLSNDKDKTVDLEVLSRLYGPDVLSSDYALDKAIFETSPKQIGFSTPSDRVSELFYALILKAIIAPTNDSTIYAVRSNGFKGFELGDPRRHPAKMCLELFSVNEHVEMTFVQDIHGTAPPVTQAELNRIIQTLDEVPQAPDGFRVKPL